MMETNQPTETITDEQKAIQFSELKKRKTVELKQKNQSLKSEIDDWKAASERSMSLEKHHSQIRAIQQFLSGWNVKVEEKLNSYINVQDAEVFFGNCANAERLILSEHRIWDYFRSKFIQRRDETFNLYLRAADEFAWACYLPIQKAAYPKADDAKRKEPPLVFFNGGYSPFSLSRNKTFQPATVAGEPLQIDPKIFANKLPIPVVGIPWQQISHLPDALVIGHEVGHIIEADFELTERLKGILDEALNGEDEETKSRREAWHEWLGEIFADLYGCLAGGAAYAGTLIDFLVKNKTRISGEEKKSSDWGDYPTDYLRVKIVLKALEIIGFKDEIKNYQILWENYQSKMSAGFLEDIEKIVPALLEGKHDNLGGKSVKEILCFSKSQQEKANTAVKEFSKSVMNPTKLSKDMQILFAALRWSFEQDPDSYRDGNYGGKVLDHIRDNVIGSGLRAGKSIPSQINKESAGAEMAEELFKFIEAN